MANGLPYITNCKNRFFYKTMQQKKHTLSLFYLERFPLKTMFPTIFQKYFQSVRKGCAK